MQCNSCNHKVMCKHYSYALENIQVGISINDCKLYKPEFQKGESVKDTPMLSKSFDRDFMSGYTDFSSLSSTNSISAIPVEINKVICDRCKTEVHSTDIENCVECGRQVCIDCRVNAFDPSTGEVTSTCEKCWSGTPDPIPGEKEEDVKISYTTEDKNDEWSLVDFSDNTEEEKEDVKSKSVDNKSSNRKSKKK